MVIFMKRYQYKKWFINIMNNVPFGVFRVLAVILIMAVQSMGHTISAAYRAFCEDWNGDLVRSTIKDVYNWDEWGDHYDGKIG